MLKQFLTGLFAASLAVVSVPVFSHATPTTPLEFDNILDLCLYVQSNGHWFNDANDCTIYSKTQTSVVMDYRLLEIDDPITFKNLDITFTRPNGVFTFRNNGSLTIDGGTYSSPSCVLLLVYDNRLSPATFSNRITINSGTFTATSTNATSDAPASPVCLLPYAPVANDDVESIVNSYLPAGKMFQEVVSTTRTLQAQNGTVHVDKLYSNSDDVHYLNTRSVAVVDRPVVPTPEPEPTPETPETSDEPVVEETPTSIIPKAPNTGRA